MKELLDNPGFIALVGTLFGGAGLEIIRRFMDRRQRKNDEASKIRAELRVEIDGLRKQLENAAKEEQRLEAELERIKGLYYDTKEEYLSAIVELQTLKGSLENYQKQFNPNRTEVTPETATTASDAREVVRKEGLDNTPSS